MVQLYVIVPIGEGPVDPGFGGGRPSGGGRPDNSLPGGRPNHPWLGGRPDRPDQGLPGGGNYPSHGLPGQGGHPDAGLPEGPPPHPWLPAFISGNPHRPDNSLPLPPMEGHPAPPIAEGTPPGTIWPPLPPSVPKGIHAVLVWISGLGYRYAVIDTSLSPDQGLPPAPQPK